MNQESPWEELSRLSSEFTSEKAEHARLAASISAKVSRIKELLETCNGELASWGAELSPNLDSPLTAESGVPVARPSRDSRDSRKLTQRQAVLLALFEIGRPTTVEELRGYLKGPFSGDKGHVRVRNALAALTSGAGSRGEPLAVHTGATWELTDLGKDRAVQLKGLL